MCDTELCDREPSIGRLCQPCLEGTRDHPGLLDDLGSIATTLVTELNVTIVRSDRLGQVSTGVVASDSERPVAFNERASEAAGALRRTVAYWVREMLIHYGQLRCMEPDVQHAAGWLAAMPELLADHPQAGGMRCQIREVVHEAYRVIDRPAVRRYAGLCECGAVLYTSHREFSCAECGRTWTVNDEALREALDEQLVPVSVLVGLVTGMGKYLTRSMVAGWKRRQLIAPAGMDDQGRDLFRVGDVLDRLVQSS